MNPNNDHLWISREEYDRLRQAEMAAGQITAAPPATAIDPLVGVKTLDRLRKQQSFAALFIAVAFVLSLTSPILGFITGPLILILIVFAISGFVQYRRTEHSLVYGQAVKQPRSTKKLVLIILGCLLLAPVIFYGGMIIILIIVFTAGGGRGS